MGSLSRQSVREYDRAAIEAGVPGPVLMENAATGCARLLLSLGLFGPVGIVCGKGNNGGDGFVIARVLSCIGIPVTVELVVPASELTGDAAIAFAPLEWMGVPIRNVDSELNHRLRHCQWVVDAVLGTGAQGEIRSPFREAIEAMNQSHRSILAVDLPSGMDTDTGLPLGPTVRASRTATFVARKCGFDNPKSLEYTGIVHVLPIGVGTRPLESKKPSL